MEDIWKSLREMEWDDIVPEKDVIQRPSIPGPYAGQKHTEEVKQLMRAYVKTEEHRDRLRESARHRWENNIGNWTPPPTQKGKKYWTDGKTNKMSFNSPGDGWRLGRVSNSKPPSQKGKTWWNNRQINKLSVECPGIEWCRGML